MKSIRKAAGCFAAAGMMVLASASPAFAEDASADADVNISAGVSSALYEIMESEATSDQEGNTADPEWADKAMPKLDTEGECVNVRADADETAEVVGKLYRGDGAKVVEQGDGWTKITSGNLTGYVRSDLLAIGDEAKAIAEEQGSWVATVNTQTLYVREEASEDADIAGMAAEGDEMNVSTETEVPEGWVAVAYEGSVDYVSDDYVDQSLVVGTGVTLEEEAAQQAALAAQNTAAASATTTGSTTAGSTDAAGTAAAGTTTKAVAASASNSQSQSTSSASTSASASVSVSSDSATLLAALIQCEAGGEPYEGQVAVGAVVLNRVASGTYPNSISEVIYQSGQFGPVSNGSLARTLSTGTISSSCYAAAQDALAGSDPVSGATHFGCGTSGIKIGGHYFF